MKKILALVLSIFVGIQSFGQVNPQEKKAQTFSVDTLVLRLDKLQHDYEFLYCEYQISGLAQDLKELANSTNIAIHDVIIEYYHSKYDSDLYDVYVDGYNVKQDLLEVLKGYADSLRILVSLKMYATGFTEEETEVIKRGFNVVQSSVETCEAALKYLNAALKAYRNK